MTKNKSNEPFAANEDNGKKHAPEKTIPVKQDDDNDVTAPQPGVTDPSKTDPTRPDAPKTDPQRKN